MSNEHFDDAAEMMLSAEQQLVVVNEACTAAIRDRDIGPKLRVGVKHVLGDLQSALDYVACGLVARGSSASSTAKPSFPWARKVDRAAEFRRKASQLPGVDPAVFARIEGYQHFSPTGFVWLPDLMELNNENKHRRLSAQHREERHDVVVVGGPAGGRIGGFRPQDARIEFGHGASITVEGAWGGSQPAALPMTTGDAAGRVQVWERIVFSDFGHPVVEFLTTAVRGIGGIVRDAPAW